MSAKWRPTPFLKLCIAAHPLMLAALRLRPGHWPVVLGLFCLTHASIALAGLLPRCPLLGRVVTRLPPAARQARQVALTFDDGPDPEVTPAILAILAQYRVRATFFCIGSQAERHPALCRQIVAAGHDIENHGQRHRVPTALSGPAGWRREVMEGAATLSRLTGRMPRFFRPIAGLRNPFLDPLLQGEGLILACWSVRGYDTRAQSDEALFDKLTAGLKPGAIVLMHDGHAARDASGRPIIVNVLPRMLETLQARRLTAVTLREGCRLS